MAITTLDHANIVGILKKSGENLLIPVGEI